MRNDASFEIIKSSGIASLQRCLEVSVLVCMVVQVGCATPRAKDHRIMGDFEIQKGVTLGASMAGKEWRDSKDPGHAPLIDLRMHGVSPLAADHLINALVYISLGKLPEAMGYYQKALVESRKVGDLTGEARALANIGAVFHEMGQYSKALESMYLAREAAQRIGDTNGESRAVRYIETSHARLGGQMAESSSVPSP